MVQQVNMRKLPVAVTPLAPLGDRTKQTKWAGSDNLFASVVSPLFQQAMEQGRITKNTMKVSSAEADLLSNEAALLLQHKQTLTDHLDARLQAFFREIIDCYDTNKFYEEGKVEDQLASSHSLKWEAADGRKGTLKFESAHDGTIPCLLSYQRTAYQQWKLNPGLPKPPSIVHGKHTDTHLLNNACDGHLKSVNQADSLIDWQAEADIIIRPFTIDLLNAAATKTIDPLTGMLSFIGKLSDAVGRLSVDYAHKPALKAIFETYKEHLNYVLQTMQQDPDAFFTVLLGIKINANDPHLAKLRTVIYPHRFKTLKTAAEIQGNIVARVQQAKEAVLARQVKPNTFDNAFKARVVIQAFGHSVAMGKVFQRHFCMNLAQATQAFEAAYSPAQTLVSNPASNAELHLLFADVDKLLHNHTIDISLLRANLLKHLREIKHWSQTDVATKMKGISPQLTMYQQRISKLERGEEKITDNLADIFAQVFQLDRSVFIADLAPYAVPL